MNLYVEKEIDGQYGLVDTFINETVNLNTKTIYVQDITAVFKGFTNDFSVSATPNTIKLLGYFGYTEQMAPAKIQKRAKLFLNDELYREGIITLKNVSWINGNPSLFELEFSDGQKNLTELIGEDTLSMLGDNAGDIVWDSRNIEKALQSIQTASGGVRWFIPLVSNQRIFTISNSPEALPTDNINYDVSKLITSENVLLPNEIRPAMFVPEILDKINKKYDIKIDPKPYIGNNTQLTDLCTMCTSEISVLETKAKITKSVWDYDAFVEERFDIIPKPLIDAFELNYLGYGDGEEHDGTFDMIIQLAKTGGEKDVKRIGRFIYDVAISAEDAVPNYIHGLEIWEVDTFGNKKKKLNYTKRTGEGVTENNSNLTAIIGLDIFIPEGAVEPSTLIKPLISIFVSSENLSGWKYTNVTFNWHRERLKKFLMNNIQPVTEPTTVNLFKSLSNIKIIDFVKSIYTMFGYKKFKDEILNDFYYVPKTINNILQVAHRKENDLTPYADLSKITKKTNTRYDGYNLKHATSSYQQNVLFLANNEMEYGQLKYPLSGKPKTEFKIETVFTVPVFNPVISDADTQILTFYPFGSEPKLNDLETRYIFDTITKEFPIFYYNGVENISTKYAFVDTDSKIIKAIGKYHKISHKSNRIKTGLSNYISSLFNIVTGDFIDQNTLYVQDYKSYIEDTLSGKKLIHTINLELPVIEIQKFDNSQEIIIKETKYNVLESDIDLTNGKTKLTLLNK